MSLFALFLRPLRPLLCPVAQSLRSALILRGDWSTRILRSWWEVGLRLLVRNPLLSPDTFVGLPSDLFTWADCDFFPFPVWPGLCGPSAGGLPLPVPSRLNTPRGFTVPAPASLLHLEPCPSGGRALTWPLQTRGPSGGPQAVQAARGPCWPPDARLPQGPSGLRPRPDPLRAHCSWQSLLSRTLFWVHRAVKTAFVVLILLAASV